MKNKKYVFWCTVSSAIWDSIVYIPVFREIKQLYPESKIMIITGNLLWLNFYRECKYIDEIIIVNTNSSILDKLSTIFKIINSWIDYYLDFNWDKASFIIWLLTLTFNKICFNNNQFRFFYKYITNIDSLNEIFNWEPSLINLYQNILYWYNTKIVNNDSLELKNPNYSDNEGGYKINGEYIVVHFWWMERNIETNWLNERCWNTNNWVELLKKIQNTNKQIIIVFVWWKDNLEPINEILNNIDQSRIINYVNKLNIVDTIKVINNCKLFIWTDSWPIHIAAALNKKVIWIIWWKMHNINKYISNLIQKNNVLDITVNEVFYEYKKI